MRERQRERRLSPYELLAGTSTTTAGKLAARAWLDSLALTPPTHWYVEVMMSTGAALPTLAFDRDSETRFRLEVFSEEWGVYFCHRGAVSWIRVTDLPFVHGRDDFGLAPIMPPLKNVGRLVRAIETVHGLCFDRDRALVRSNVPHAESTLAPWIRAL
jgi:hypothetical protein